MQASQRQGQLEPKRNKQLVIKQPKSSCQSAWEADGIIHLLQFSAPCMQDHSHFMLIWLECPLCLHRRNEIFLCFSVPFSGVAKTYAKWSVGKLIKTRLVQLKLQRERQEKTHSHEELCQLGVYVPCMSTSVSIARDSIVNRDRDLQVKKPVSCKLSTRKGNLKPNKNSCKHI